MEPGHEGFLILVGDRGRGHLGGGIDLVDGAAAVKRGLGEACEDAGISCEPPIDPYGPGESAGGGRGRI